MFTYQRQSWRKLSISIYIDNKMAEKQKQKVVGFGISTSS